MSKSDVLTFLSKNPGEHTVKEMAKGIGISKNAICSALSKLRSQRPPVKTGGLQVATCNVKALTTERRKQKEGKQNERNDYE